MTLPPDLAAKYGRDNYYREWCDKIPHIPFLHEWDVRAIPPFGGALIRYIVRFEAARVSIYLDADNSLGYGPEPAYWEAYPYEGDVFRCAIDEVIELADAVQKSIQEQLSGSDSGEARGEVK